MVHHVFASERQARPTLAEDEIASWMPEHIKRIVLLVGLVGLRFTEALTLTDDRIDLDRGELFVPGRLSKNRKPKSISLAAREVQLLREQLLVRAPDSTHVFATRRGNGYTRSAFNEHAWWPALEKLGLKKELHFHDLRHTAISLSRRRPGYPPRSSPNASGTQTAAR